MIFYFKDTKWMKDKNVFIGRKQIHTWNAFNTTLALMQHSLKAKKLIEKLKETRDSRYIYQKQLDKACFQHDKVMKILSIFA